MKFYCDACNTKYSIPDEKVQGKVLKVRCKSCGNVITVKEQVAPRSGTEPTMMGSRPVPPPPPPQSVGPSVPPNNWHYSVNGQAAGPYLLKALRERFASGSLGDEAYVWHETLVAWMPVRDVPAFHDALAKGQAIRPRAKTLGFTGPLEAIKVDAQPKGQQGGEVPSVGPTVETPRLKQAPPIAKKTPELRPTPEPVPRQDRLEKLREKLKNDVPAPTFKPSSDLPKSADPRSDAHDLSPQEDTAKITFGQVPQKPELKTEPKPFEPTTPEPQKPALPTFELKPFSAALFDQPAKDEISDPLEQWASEEPETTEDSGLIPFFNDAPKLGAPSTSVAPTGSLLIQLDSIQKEGRNKKLVGVAGGVVVLLLAIGIGAYLSRQAPEERPIVASVAEKRAAPVEKVYSKKQLTGLGIELEEEVLVESEGEVEEEESTEPAAIAAQASTKSTSDTKAPAEKKAKAVESVAKTAPKQTEERADSGTAVPVNAQSVLNYSNPTAVQRSSSPIINRPDDKFGTQTPTTLTTESAREGFQTIRRSVEQCRARHMRRGAKLEANKISVRVTVEPSGTVSKYVLEPKTVANTEFDLCMGSHRDRWRFARWDGDATEVASSFVLN